MNSELSKEKELHRKEVSDLTAKVQEVGVARYEAIKRKAKAKEANLRLITKKVDLDKEKAKIDTNLECGMAVYR